MFSGVGWTSLLACLGVVFAHSADWHRRLKQKASSLDTCDVGIILRGLAQQIRLLISIEHLTHLADTTRPDEEIRARLL